MINITYAMYAYTYVLDIRNIMTHANLRITQRESGRDGDRTLGLQ